VQRPTIDEVEGIPRDEKSGRGRGGGFKFSRRLGKEGPMYSREMNHRRKKGKKAIKKTAVSPKCRARGIKRREDHITRSDQPQTKRGRGAALAQPKQMERRISALDRGCGFRLEGRGKDDAVIFYSGRNTKVRMAFKL